MADTSPFWLVVVLGLLVLGVAMAIAGRCTRQRRAARKPVEGPEYGARESLRRRPF
jgi:hypothetical protein